MIPKQIKNQKELDELLSKHDLVDCFIQLNYGLRSSKDISFTENKDYSVFNDVDGSEEIIPRKELKNSFLGKALIAGALYKY